MAHLKEDDKGGPRQSGTQQHNADDADAVLAGTNGRPSDGMIVITAIMSSTFLYALDNTVTANVRPSMIESPGNRIDMLPWLSVSYPMGEVGSNPCGRSRPVFLSGRSLRLHSPLGVS